ncbi:glutamic-oxaloacetic transaminase 1 [Salpingoeca rosetta]|uniref:Aspartate aminotransferase n=1 Tax=Salpingoeca rosetta (strain ATCC 50818 / BSB-021) TaxID=946362 RepID=F2UDS4_SALR5|nr:glutamic-oxaloacetic transaminase 1 [Salpingoeca rosetta]EGD74774.1 glutamic-oxaloacetic transaminase 1 [Salpingoeca rosetta]|eukprot:XP_004992419.1 glutamic-oxaloacetic transaminase 1 [Salpingoeca rosetta]
MSAVAAVLAGGRIAAASASAKACAATTAVAASRMSLWAHVQQGPPDPILGLTEAYNKDTFPNKVNLGVGAYRDDEGKPHVLQCVTEAEKRLLDAHLNKEYASIQGPKDFRDASAKLALADADNALAEGRVTTVQSISGTGGLRVAGIFLAQFYNFPNKDRAIYLPTPTWSNHLPIFRACGIEPRTYSYYDKNTCGLDFKGMMQDLDKLENGSVVLLHACAQNPTGVDPTPEQWHEIATLIKQKNHLPVFDMAYQGFASGDYDKDAYAVRHFCEQGMLPFVIQSYSKNMGLYGERVGALNVVTTDPQQASAIESQLKIMIRALYSNPPIHGARIVATVLNDNDLHALLLKETHAMADRITSMRTRLVEELAKAGSKLDWSHIQRQIGMFCFSGLTEQEVQELISTYHIYLTKNGRISMAGVSSGNVEYLAHAMHAVTAHRE